MNIHETALRVAPLALTLSDQGKMVLVDTLKGSWVIMSARGSRANA